MVRFYLSICIINDHLLFNDHFLLLNNIILLFGSEEETHWKTSDETHQ